MTFPEAENDWMPRRSGPVVQPTTKFVSNVQTRASISEGSATKGGLSRLSPSQHRRYITLGKEYHTQPTIVLSDDHCL